MSTDISVYPSLLVLIPMLIAPLFLLARHKYSKLLLITIIITIDGLLIYSLWMKMPIEEYTGGWVLRGIHLHFDRLSVIYTSLFLIVILTSWLSSLRKDYPPIFYFLTTLLLATFNTSAITMDLFNIYVVLELSSIIAYILIAMPHKWKHMWTSLKYLMMSYFAFTMYLTAVGLIYMKNGTFDISRIKGPVSPIIIAMIFIPLLLKAGLFPVSMWLPSAHSLAQTEVSAILSGSFVKMGSIISFRLLGSPAFKEAYLSIIIIALLSAIVGVIYAYNDKNVKRILAFHTLSQMGYVFAGGPLYGSIHAFNHAIFKSLLFLTVGDQKEEVGHYDISIMKHTKFPFYRYVFLTIGVLGITGVPLFSGYVSKSLILHHSPTIVKIALILASLGTVASMSKLMTVGYRKSQWKHNLAYYLLGSIIILVGIYGFTYTFSLVSLIESLTILVIGFLIYKYIHPSPLSRVLEKLDIMVIEYMLALLGMTIIIAMQR